MKTLLTGAAGKVARQLRGGLGGLRLRVTDARPVEEWYVAACWTDERESEPLAGARAEPHEAPTWREPPEALAGDLGDRDFAEKALAGVEAVLHLAANPDPGARWPDLRRPNVDALVTVLETARDLGVRRVVLASSVHAVGGYVLAGEPLIDPAWPVAPCCEYGTTKALAEAMGRFIAGSSETSVLCLRLGACLPDPSSRAEMAAWLGPADLQRLIRAALTADVRFGTYFGVSANTPPGFDLANARRELGYVPELDAASYRDELPAGDLSLGHRR